MEPKRWQIVEDLLDKALETPPDARDTFLRSVFAPELRAEVESLLACNANADGFLQSPAIALSNDFFDADESPDTHLNQTIGSYKIIRELGLGGMGAVFLAERSDGAFEQRVALKIVRRSFADREIQRRFRQERQILASLNHPNIARLLDGGVSESGEPFLVMEYVEGERINDYCHKKDLSIDERLKLFIAVCNAVGYAHQNLVVHRDIKPSNILVTNDGVPKLLDFGIAKLLGAEHSEEHTQTGLRAFTAEYASPEQIAGEKVTTATDVYSLGVLLCEMLYEARCSDGEPSAFGKRRSKESANSARRTFSTNVPTGEDGKKLTDAELNNIIAMARREEPARRYASVQQFAEDIQRYLDGLPVRAERDSFTYRAGKFVKRNRLSVAALALVILSLIAGVAVAAWQASIASEKASIAEENQGRAEAAADKQKKITGFMEKVLSYASPAWYAEGNRFKGEARVIDVLNELSGKIETEFSDDVDIQAELHHKCAEIFLANLMFDRAETHARRALELRRQIFGERHAEVAKDMYYLGEVLGVYGSLLEKEKLLIQAAVIFREVAPDNANLPYLLESLGDLKMEAYDDFDEAENLFAESLALFRRRDGEIHFNTARLYFQLSVAVASKGEWTRAEELFREGEWRAAGLPNAEHRLQTLGHRGTLEFVKGNATAAEAAFKQMLSEIKKLEGENKGDERNVRGSLLEIYRRENDWAKAVEVQRTNAEEAKKRMSETSFGFGKELAVLSVYLFRAGETEEAKRHFEKAYRLFQNNKSNAETSEGFGLEIAEALLLQNRHDEALPLLELDEFYRANYPPKFITRVRAEKLLAKSRSQNRD